MDLGITAEQCRSAYAAGDMAFYNAQRCTDTVGTSQLIDQKKRELNTKTYVIIGISVIAVGTILYFTMRKSK